MKKKKSKFRKHASLRDNDSMFKLILHARRLEFLRTAFTVNLSAVALLMNNLGRNTVYYLFFLQVQESALN